MFNIGWSEFAIIGVVALLVVGPKDLPAMLRTLGKFVGQIRRMASDFQGQFNEALREAELYELKEEAKKIADPMSFSPLEDARRSMAEFNKTLSDEAAAIKAVANADTTTVSSSPLISETANAVETKAEPIAEAKAEPIKDTPKKPAQKKSAQKKPATKSKDLSSTSSPVAQPSAKTKSVAESKPKTGARRKPAAKSTGDASGKIA